MSYENWKHILSVFSFQNSIFNCIFVIKHTLRDLRLEQQPQLLTSLFFFTGFGEFGWSSSSSFSFSFHIGLLHLFFFFFFPFAVGVCLSFDVKSVWVSVLNRCEFWCWVSWVRCWLSLSFGVESVWISVLNWWVACRFGCRFFLGLVSGGGERWRAFFWDLLFVVDGDGE